MRIENGAKTGTSACVRRNREQDDSTNDRESQVKNLVPEPSVLSCGRQTVPIGFTASDSVATLESRPHGI